MKKYFVTRDWSQSNNLVSKALLNISLSLTSFGENLELNNVVVLLTDICARHL